MKIYLIKIPAQTISTFSITILIFSITTLFAITSCTTPPGKAIQKRWKTVGVVGNEHKQNEYKEQFKRQTVELEFLPGGIFRGIQKWKTAWHR